MATLDGIPKKAVQSLLLLVNLEVWKERNARTFVRKELSATALGLFQKIKEEAHLWGLTGTKHLVAL